MDELQENGDSTNKVFEYSLAPCDKVATLYVMQQKMDSPIYNIPEWVWYEHCTDIQHIHFVQKLIVIILFVFGFDYVSVGCISVESNFRI